MYNLDSYLLSKFWESSNQRGLTKVSYPFRIERTESNKLRVLMSNSCIIKCSSLVHPSLKTIYKHGVKNGLTSIYFLCTLNLSFFSIFYNKVDHTTALFYNTLRPLIWKKNNPKWITHSTILVTIHNNLTSTPQDLNNTLNNLEHE